MSGLRIECPVPTADSCKGFAPVIAAEQSLSLLHRIYPIRLGRIGRNRADIGIAESFYARKSISPVGRNKQPLLRRHPDPIPIARIDVNLPGRMILQAQRPFPY